MGHFFAYQRVESVLRKRYPQVGDNIRMQESFSGQPPSMLTLSMEDGSKVLLWLTRFAPPYERDLFWVVADPGDGEIPRIWSPDTSDEMLADAVYERFRARMAHRGEVSPWKWDEPDSCDVVKLADALAEHRITVQRVVANNRLRAVTANDGIKAHRFPAHEGRFLDLQQGSLSVRIACKVSLGWLIDVYDVERGCHWRVDLHHFAFGEESRTPGVSHGDLELEDLVEVVESLLDYPGGYEPSPSAILWTSRRDTTVPEMVTHQEDRESSHSPHTLSTAIVRQLSSMGFMGMELDSESPPCQSEHVAVAWWKRSKNLGISDIKTLYADASVEDKRLVVIIEGDATRPAMTFADKAKVFLFGLDRRQAHLYPISKLATEAAFIGR
jgi:hypothetical protein